MSNNAKALKRKREDLDYLFCEKIIVNLQIKRLVINLKRTFKKLR